MMVTRMLLQKTHVAHPTSYPTSSIYPVAFFSPIVKFFSFFALEFSPTNGSGNFSLDGFFC
jgi:hypothetical protein